MRYIMCPSGKCVSDFEECLEKNYKCVNSLLEKCGDGFCRESCDGIPTNGCPASQPVYCQNGSCVRFAEECFDFKCPLDKPILCSNNECASSYPSCPENVMSTLIMQKEETVVASHISSIEHDIQVQSQRDPKQIKLRLNIPLNSLYYPDYTAGFARESGLGLVPYQSVVKVSPVPRSDYRDTKLRYLEFNIDAEDFTNKVFSRRLGLLEPFQFLRSFVFQVSVKEYAYNNHLFKKPITAVIDYNKVKGYPGFEEVLPDDDEETRHKGQDEYVTMKDAKINELYNPQSPENYYCLGLLNPRTNLWKCVNRSILDISSESIVYNIPSPGIYSVLFFPKLHDSELGRCGVICRNKNVIVRFFVFYIPVVVIWVLYFLYYFRKMLSDVRDLFQNKSKIEASFARVKRQKGEARRRLAELQSGHSGGRKSTLAVFDKAKKRSQDEETVRMLMSEKNYDIKSDMKTFMNPLVLTKKSTSEASAKISEMEKKAVRLRYRKKQLMTSKIYKINRLIILKEQMYDFQRAINELNSIEGNQKVYLMEGDLVESRVTGGSGAEHRESLLSLSNEFGSRKLNRYVRGRSRRKMISVKSFSDESSISYGD